MLMRDDLSLLFPKMPQVRTMHAWLCSDLAVLVEEMAHYVVLLHDNLFSASMRIFSKLYSF